MDNPRTILIAGASGGVGTAVVKKFYDLGDNIVLGGRKLDGLESTASSLSLADDRFMYGTADQTDPAAVKTMVQEAITRFGAIDVLVNVTGGWQGGQVASTEPSKWEFMMALNLNSAFYIANAVLPGMIERESGKLIFVSARPAETLSGGATAYSTSKAGVNALVKNISSEVRDNFINVNAIAPSTVDTPANRSSMPNADFSKWVTPESLAEVIAFLASDAAKDVHGAIVPVYGPSK